MMSDAERVSWGKGREYERFMRAWGDVLARGDDAERQRLLDEFVRECPGFELHAKVFFELEHRMRTVEQQTVDAVAAYARQLLSSPAAEFDGVTDEFVLAERVQALLRIGLALSSAEPGKRAVAGSTDPRLAAVAVEAFQRVGPAMAGQPPVMLAQFDIFVAHALMDCDLTAEAAARARKALNLADATIVGADEGVSVTLRWANLRREAEALIAAAESGKWTL